MKNPENTSVVREIRRQASNSTMRRFWQALPNYRPVLQSSETIERLLKELDAAEIAEKDQLGRRRQE